MIDKFIDFVEVTGNIFMISHTNCPYGDGEYVDSKFVRSKLNNSEIKVTISNHSGEEIWKNFHQDLK